MMKVEVKNVSLYYKNFQALKIFPLNWKTEKYMAYLVGMGLEKLHYCHCWLLREPSAGKFISMGKNRLKTPKLCRWSPLFMKRL